MVSFTGNTTAQEVVTAFAKEIPTKTVLITGASQGSLGAEAAKSLASAKYVILAGRNEAKIAPVLDEVRKLNPSGKTAFVQADLADNDSIRQAATKINGLPGLDHIDIVINAAGNMAVRNFQPSADGFELQFAANHLGHFLLTKLILDKILASPAPTVVNLTSTGYELSEVLFDDVNFNDGKSYDPWVAYGQAKTANILHVVGLHGKYSSKNLASFAVHPGFVPESQLLATNGVDQDLMIEGYKLSVARNNGNDIPPPTPRSLQEGSATLLLAALDPSLRGKSPTLLFEGQVHPDIKAYALDKQGAEKLWELSNKLTQ
ncbi:putative short-chain dehydrogenase [Astrocystis sublimbata]|nr:putative short-chain dehydrogenase [Astrocystis sublimbata]